MFVCASKHDQKFGFWDKIGLKWRGRMDTELFKEWKTFKCPITEDYIHLPNLIIIYNSRLVELTEIRRHGYVFRMDYESFLSRYKMLSVHTWPHWTAGGPVDGVTCLLRDLPISANEYSFGRSKIFIRTSKTVRFSKIVPNFCRLVFDPIDI